MFRKILLYGLPVYLYALELLLKAIASVSADSVAGPTLAGAGIGFILPLTELKPVTIDSQLAKALSELKARAYSPRDKAFTDMIWVMFFLCLGGWMYSLYLTFVREYQPQDVNWSLVIGCVTFVISILLTEVKERL